MNLITFQFDPSASNSNNLVTNESHALTDSTAGILLANAGLFYVKTLIVSVPSTNRILVRDTDYTITGFDSEATALTGYECASAISLSPSIISGTISLQYQAVGGMQGQNSALVKQLRDTVNLLAEQNPTWAEVINKPNFYPALPHVHNPVTDLVGLNALNNVLTKIFESLHNNRIPALGGESLNNKIDRVLTVIASMRHDINILGNVINLNPIQLPTYASKESASNKTQVINSNNISSTVQYPSVNAVVNYIVNEMSSVLTSDQLTAALANYATTAYVNNEFNNQLFNYAQNGANGFLRALNDIIAEEFNVKNFGATGLGEAVDDSAAFLLTFNKALQYECALIKIPAGKFRLDQGIVGLLTCYATQGIRQLSTVTMGSGYTPGTYSNIRLNYISGTTSNTLPRVNITVNSSGQVSQVTMVTFGSGYVDTSMVMGLPTTGLTGALAGLAAGSGFTTGILSLTGQGQRIKVIGAGPGQTTLMVNATNGGLQLGFSSWLDPETNTRHNQKVDRYSTVNYEGMAIVPMVDGAGTGLGYSFQPNSDVPALNANNAGGSPYGQLRIYDVVVGPLTTFTNTSFNIGVDIRGTCNPILWRVVVNQGHQATTWMTAGLEASSSYGYYIDHCNFGAVQGYFGIKDINVSVTESGYIHNTDNAGYNVAMISTRVPAGRNDQFYIADSHMNGCFMGALFQGQSELKFDSVLFLAEVSSTNNYDTYKDIVIGTRNGRGTTNTQLLNCQYGGGMNVPRRRHVSLMNAKAADTATVNKKVKVVDYCLGARTCIPAYYVDKNSHEITIELPETIINDAFPSYPLQTTLNPGYVGQTFVATGCTAQSFSIVSGNASVTINNNPASGVTPNNGFVLTLPVGSFTGTIVAGMTITGTGNVYGTTTPQAIKAVIMPFGSNQTTGTGAAGTYALSNYFNLTNVNISSNTLLTVGTVVGGMVMVGQMIFSNTTSSGVTITSAGNASNKWFLSSNETVSDTVTGILPTFTTTAGRINNLSAGNIFTIGNNESGTTPLVNQLLANNAITVGTYINSVINSTEWYVNFMQPQSVMVNQVQSSVYTTFSGSITGNVLTATKVVGAMKAGQLVVGSGVVNVTYIISKGTVANTWVLNNSYTNTITGNMTSYVMNTPVQCIFDTPFTITGYITQDSIGGVLNVVTGNTPSVWINMVGTMINSTSTNPGTAVTEQLTGIGDGVGTYRINSNITAGSSGSPITFTCYPYPILGYIANTIVTGTIVSNLMTLDNNSGVSAGQLVLTANLPLGTVITQANGNSWQISNPPRNSTTTLVTGTIINLVTPNVVINASISNGSIGTVGRTITISGSYTGTIANGMLVFGVGIAYGTYIVGTDSSGNWIVNQKYKFSGTLYLVNSTFITSNASINNAVTGNTLTFTDSTAPIYGELLVGPNVIPGTTVCYGTSGTYATTVAHQLNTAQLLMGFKPTTFLSDSIINDNLLIVGTDVSGPLTTGMALFGIGVTLGTMINDWSSDGLIYQLNTGGISYRGRIYASIPNAWFNGTIVANTDGTGTLTTTPILIPVGQLVVGNTYTISTSGNTNWLLLGSTSNNAGTTFTATGNGNLGETGVVSVAYTVTINQILIGFGVTFGTYITTQLTTNTFKVNIAQTVSTAVSMMTFNRDWISSQATIGNPNPLLSQGNYLKISNIIGTAGINQMIFGKNIPRGTVIINDGLDNSNQTWMVDSIANIYQENMVGIYPMFKAVNCNISSLNASGCSVYYFNGAGCSINNGFSTPSAGYTLTVPSGGFTGRLMIGTSYNALDGNGDIVGTGTITGFISDITNGTYIGTANGGGYNLSQNATANAIDPVGTIATTAVATNCVLNTNSTDVNLLYINGSIPYGTIATGNLVFGGPNIPYGTFITNQVSGTPGSAGVYTMSSPSGNIISHATTAFTACFISPAVNSISGCNITGTTLTLPTGSLTTGIAVGMTLISNKLNLGITITGSTSNPLVWTISSPLLFSNISIAFTNLNMLGTGIVGSGTGSTITISNITYGSVVQYSMLISTKLSGGAGKYTLSTSNFLPNVTVQSTVPLLTVGTVSTGTVAVGEVLTGSNLIANTQVIGTNGLAWVLDTPQDTVSTTIVSPGTLSIGYIEFGVVMGNELLYGINLLDGTYIVSNSADNDPNTFTINNVQNVSNITVWGFTMSRMYDVKAGSSNVKITMGDKTLYSDTLPGRYQNYGPPNSNQVGAIGSEYVNLSGGIGNTKWVKTTGTGNTGWTNVT